VTKFENFNEEPLLGLFLTGLMENQSWALKDRKADFYHLKAYYQNLLYKVGINHKVFSIQAPEDSADIFEGGLEYRDNEKTILKAGIVNSDLLDRFDIDQEVYFAEIYWDRLLPLINTSKSFNELPKYPEVRRDLALLLDEHVQYSQIETLALEAETRLLKRIELFDYYKGKNIPKGKKSYAVSFILQDLKKTLTDKEIDRIMAKITNTMVQQLNADLR
jgi:phenylalanyl-tRNA synthetase beta chain